MAGIGNLVSALGGPLRSGANLVTQFGASRMNAAVTLLRALASGANLEAGPGIRLVKGPNGVVIIGDPKGKGASSVATLPEPFDVTLSAGETEGTVKASVWPGTVNNLLPTNYATVATLSTTGTYYLTLDVTAADNAITAVVLASSTTPPAVMPQAKNGLPTTAKILFAMVVDGQRFQIRNGNQTLAPRELFRLEKSPVVPGSLPWDSYWGWEIDE